MTGTLTYKCIQCGTKLSEAAHVSAQRGELPLCDVDGMPMVLVAVKASKVRTGNKDGA